MWFSPTEMSDDLVSFLLLAAEFYDRARYYGDCRLTVTLVLPKAHPLKPGAFRGHWITENIFEPYPDIIDVGGSFEVPVTSHPATAQRVTEYLEIVMNEVARMAGSVFNPSFRAVALDIISNDAAIKSYLNGHL